MRLTEIGAAMSFRTFGCGVRRTVGASWNVSQVIISTTDRATGLIASAVTQPIRCTSGEVEQDESAVPPHAGAEDFGCEPAPMPSVRGFVDKGCRRRMPYLARLARY